ncbi:MAG: GNAT family N-acetyltransferase [Bosea sp. (in: a-proteobacteria)]
MPLIRPATRADLPRIHEVRHGTAENRLLDPSRVTNDEVIWYLDHAIFLVSEDAAGVVQGFGCANPQTGYVWALFVIDGEHRQGHGKALQDAMLAKLAASGNRQAYLTTGAGTAAEQFYLSQGWRDVGRTLGGEVAFRIAL